MKTRGSGRFSRRDWPPRAGSSRCPRAFSRKDRSSRRALGRRQPYLPNDTAAQSSGSTFTIRWSWLLPTQNVVGVVDLSTNTVRMLVSDGIRYCTVVPVLGSRRTTRSVCIVDAQISPFLSKSARYGYVRGGKSYSVNFSALVSNSATLLPRYSVTTMRSWSSMFMRRPRAFSVGNGHHVTFVVLASILPIWPRLNSAIHRLFCESEMT